MDFILNVKEDFGLTVLLSSMTCGSSWASAGGSRSGLRGHHRKDAETLSPMEKIQNSTDPPIVSDLPRPICRQKESPRIQKTTHGPSATGMGCSRIQVFSPHRLNERAKQKGGTLSRRRNNRCSPWDRGLMSRPDPPDAR